VGIDTLGFSSAATADVLRTALPGLSSGALKPFLAVSGSSRDRIILGPRR
jgi:hypothetical protein